MFRIIGSVIFATEECSAFDFAVLHVAVSVNHAENILNQLVYNSTHESNQIFHVATRDPSELHKVTYTIDSTSSRLYGCYFSRVCLCMPKDMGCLSMIVQWDQLSPKVRYQI